MTLIKALRGLTLTYEGGVWVKGTTESLKWRYSYDYNIDSSLMVNPTEAHRLFGVDR